jgi:hypothetical protein
MVIAVDTIVAPSRAAIVGAAQCVSSNKNHQNKRPPVDRDHLDQPAAR